MRSDKLWDKLQKTLKDNPCSLSELSSKFRTSKSHIKKTIRDMKKHYINIVDNKIDGTTKYYIPLKLPQIEPEEVKTDCFGFTSDWHVGNKYVEEECLLDYLDTLKDYGIKVLFHGGDVVDGTGVYLGQINDLLPDCVNLQGQIDYFNKLIKTDKKLQKYFISGNHCLKNYRKQGVDPVKIICDNRSDAEYLGQYYGRAKLKDVLLEIAHPSGAAPYSKEYRILTYLRDRPVDSYPDILGIGHLHAALFKETQGVLSYILGSFLGDTDYTRRRGISPSVGGWIVELDIEDGNIKKVKSEWVKY